MLKKNLRNSVVFLAVKSMAVIHFQTFAKVGILVGNCECCNDVMCRVAGIWILLSIHAQIVFIFSLLKENARFLDYGDEH